MAGTALQNFDSVLDFRMHVPGAKAAVARVEAFEVRASDLTPAWPAVLEVARGVFRQQWATEGARAGRPWRSLAPRTQRERARLGYGPAHPILRRSDNLLRSLTETTGDTILVQAERYFAVGSADPTFQYHQSTQPRKRIPRRPIAVFTARDLQELRRPVVLHLTGRDPSRVGPQDAAFSNAQRRGPG